MTTILKSGGLQHAYSLGNIDTSTRHGNPSSRNYDSEDENICRKKGRSTSSYPKPSVYSKADIQEQYCLSERQLHTMERSRRDGFFGCWSSHNSSQSFLSVCVGRRNPSDENLADSAPFYKYPRYPQAVNGQQGIMRNGDDAESSYFRRKPTSFLCNNDSKRFTWAKDGANVDGSNFANQQLDNAMKTPFIIDSHLQNTYANQTGSYRCPSHVGMTTSIMSAADTNVAPRTKHVSFARSHTLTSFDEVSVGSLARSVSRMSTAKSQERLIGGKKVTSSPEPHLFNLNNPQLQERKHLQTANNFVGTNISHSPSESTMLEKLKRNAMKTQATQTDVFAGRKTSMRSNMSASPRFMHRFSTMSQESQMNGNFIGRKLMKSLSEATARRRDDLNGESIVPSDDVLRQHQFHDPIFRTQSEEPRSPRDLNESIHSNSAFLNYDVFSHGSSHISDLETQGSATSGRYSGSKVSEESLPFSINEAFIDSNFLNHNTCIDFMDCATMMPVEYNSLPRRKCSYHANEYRTNSLPRKHVEQRFQEPISQEEVPICNFNLAHLRAHDTFSLESKSGSKQNVAEIGQRRYSCGVQDAMRHLNQDDFENLQTLVRRNSMNTFYTQQQSDDDDDDETESDEYCSTCSSETDSKEEKEIFIDFKPSVSPVQKRMSRTLCDEEPMEKQPDSDNEDGLITSTSEEDLRMRDNQSKSCMHTYSNVPVRQDDNLLKLPNEWDVNANNRREKFRKRSISLEKAAGEESGNDELKNRLMKSGPPSPCLDERSKNISAYPSSDSLLNDSMRDHSDGNWNESQATVLQIDSNVSDSGLVSSATIQRKNISLQRQHSSMDIEALEVEDQFQDQSIITTSSTLKSGILSATAVNNNKTNVLPVLPQPTPSIAVIPSVSMEAEDFERFNTHRKSLPSTAISNRQNTRRRSVEPIVHHYSNVKTELLRNAPVVKSSSDIQPFNRGSDLNKNATDISEGSTNTDEYMTCTEASKRGILPATASSSSTTQVPVATQSSLTLTQNGSSFESASSMYSLARVDNICDDAQVPTTEDTLPLPHAQARKPSPSHSISSSSSGSYFNGKKAVKSTSPRNSIVTQSTSTGATAKVKNELASDGEKSEKRHSSSGYYESPHEDESCRPRRPRDWNDDERRKRKEKMRLEVSNIKPSTSPTKKTGIGFKRISADDRTAMHILDGTNQTKSKRNRPKTRRSPRTRNGNEDVFTRKVRTPGASPEGVSAEMTPCRFAQQVPQISPKKRTDPSPEKRLNAVSAESLRSVSPGSDSVFYSEADVHCHHCGKEVEIVTALDEGDDPYFAQDEDQSNIVKPPADFADSPNGIRSTHRLYKKLDKRFRSEERHGERKHYRNRQSSTRAKSEERGKDDMPAERPMRPAGSTPCVAADNSFNVRDHVADPEQGIYHGFYRLGMWICIADRDVWRRQDLIDRPRDINDRRPSTESEKDFRKKYQAITHRLVHRKSCVEMYRRQANNSFSTDKSIVVRRESGEFGFRIHGSKPVVVSAIEPETPAETSGLEIGDIILSVNGVSVIDKSHSEVVKIAHAGSDVLELEVARTIGLLTSETLEVPSPSLYSGFLWRKGNNNLDMPISNQKWVRRWFCLKTDHCLYYYKNDQESNPVGAVLLTNHSIESCSSDIGRSFAFRIISNEGTSIYLAAETEEAANRWIAVTSHASKQNDQWLDVSTRNLRLPPSNVPRPDCFGFLLLQGNKWRAWSRRYCVLKDACLYFYLDGSSKNALGMACLQGYKVQPANNAVGKKYAFEITPPEPKLRHYCFSTDSDMDKKRWIAALEYSIDRWMKTL